MEYMPGNFLENIHDEEYERRFHAGLVSADSLIFDSGREKENLNGFWSFQIDQYDTCLRSGWYDEKYKNAAGRPLPVDFNFESWEKIKVPSCWNMQDDKYLYYEGPAVYTRKFRYANKGEKRVFIRFGAVNYEAKVFLNKKFAGCHKGGSTPFCIEISGLLEEDNRLLVVADNTRKAGAVPSRNTDWYNYGGIYRDVELIRLPETFIRDFFIALEPGSGFGRIRVELSVDGPEAEGEALLKIEELDLNVAIPVSGGKGTAVIDASPELWDPENPKLYDVTLRYLSDSVADKVGFREICVRGGDIYLNGKKIYLKGICIHEDSVVNGKALTEEEIVENFTIAKEMNCNYVRLAHYPHSEKASKIADSMGLMLWEEIPVYWAIRFGSADTYNDAENQLREMILRDRNRASVIIWSVGNENADTDERYAFMSSLAKEAKRLDPTRLVSAACLVDNENLAIKDRLAGCLDIVGVNEYYGWYDPDFENLVKVFENTRIDKPVIISEFGADARAGVRGMADDLGTEDCQLEVYRKQTRTLGSISCVKGISPWILYDFRCPRRHNELQKGYNTKGLLSGDKKYKKPAFYVMKEFYRNYGV
ncbi:MAG: glycoside hydrolase family 2 protein [Bacillota bacterium]